jgi:hypothetical protein
MTSRAKRAPRLRGLIGALAALVLFGGSTDLHSASTGLSTIVTTSPVLGDSPCGEECTHFDRHDGELSPDHPTARLSKQFSLAPEVPVSVPLLVATSFVRPAGPPEREQPVDRLPPARGPPAF